jgi:hypothetical protein
MASTGRRKVRCYISQLGIREPDPQELARDIADLDSLKGDQILQLCVQFAKDRPDFSAVPNIARVVTEFRQKIDSACAAKDAKALDAVLRQGTKEIDSGTCALSLSGGLEPIVFEQLDANTWESTDATACGQDTATLWRKPGEMRWSYREVIAVAPNKAACVHAKPLQDWLASGFWVRDLGCRYMKY